MEISIKYFGQIAEVTQINEEHIEFSGHDVSELLSVLHSKYENLKHKDFQVAQNQELVSEDTKITGETIALLPPFSGG